MRKVFFLFLLLMSWNGAFALYYDWEFANAFTYYQSVQTNENQTLLLNQSQLSARLNLSDDFYFRAVLKNELISITNSITNRFYLGELLVNWRNSFLNVQSGRQSFFLGNGVVVGMPGDGVNLDAVLFKNRLTVLAYSTALLPPSLNSLQLNSEDITNGSKRVIGGLRLARNGLIGDETALAFYLLYDLKNTNNLYQPWYVELDQNGAIFSSLAYSLNLYYEGGMNGNLTVSAYAGELSFLWKALKNPDLGLELNVAFASGDEERQGLYPEDITNGTDNQFIAPGTYANGIVLYPDLSNLLAFRLSLYFAYTKAFSSVLNVANYNKMNAQAPISDPLASENAASVGTEISGSLIWEPDYSLGLNVSGGVLLKSDAYLDKTPNYKLSAGVSVRI